MKEHWVSVGSVSEKKRLIRSEEIDWLSRKRPEGMREVERAEKGKHVKRIEKWRIWIININRLLR